MAEETARLDRAIEQVVTAPYVPSLQELYTQVQSTNPSAIRLWALRKPCQVYLLGDVLVDGLSWSRVALPLLSAFAIATAFRDALLTRHPAILDVFLERGIDGGEPDYHDACLSLLSSPFPPEVVQPVRLANFISKVVSIMAANPCAETLAPLHTLMTSLRGSCQILNDVPFDIMSNLQLELTKALRNLDDHMGNLLCLATFAQIALIKPNDPSKQHGPSPPSWLLNIQQFFGPKRGLKTLDLVFLRVILACSSNCTNLSTPQAAESIRLAICIADVIQLVQKQAWISSNRAKIVKLYDKVAREGLDREVQMMAVAFLFSLLPVANMPSHIRQLGLHVLVSKGDRGAMETIPQYTVSRMAQSLAYYDESAVFHLLRFVFDALTEGNMSGWNTLSDLYLAKLILSGFHSVKSTLVVSALLDSISTKDTIISLIEMFPAQSTQVQCNGADTCHCEKITLQNRVLMSLFELYFAAALSRNGNDKDTQAVKRFVNSTASLITRSNCKFLMTCNKKPYPSISGYNRKTVSAEPLGSNWRSVLTGEFMELAQTTQDSMMRKIEVVCADLDRRCREVETPLRTAEEERDKHISEVNSLKCQNEALARQLQESLQDISQLRHEVTRLEERAERSTSREDELSASLNSAQEELQHQQRHFDVALQREREEARTRELDLIATSTEKDDQLEELQQQVHHLQAENHEMQEAISAASKEQASSCTALSCMEKELSETRKALESTKALCSQKEDEIRSLLAEKEDKQKELGIMKTKVENQRLEIERLSQVLQETEQKFKFQITSLEQTHSEEIAQATLEIERHKEENQRLHAAMQAATHDATRELHSKDRRMQQLEKKIQSLRDERATKAREFSEAQQHIGRLMNVMGFSAQPAQPAVSSMTTRHQRAKSTNPRTPGNAQGSLVDEEDDESLLAESFETMANIHGSSSKRSRGIRRSMAESQESPLRATDAPVLKPSSPIVQAHPTRQPLRDANFNSPSKSSPHHPPKHDQLNSPGKNTNDENHFQDIDLDMDLEFSKDFIFTSTAFSGSNCQ